LSYFPIRDSDRQCAHNEAAFREGQARHPPYETGISVRDSEMDELNIVYEAFHGDWNYTIRPNRPATA